MNKTENFISENNLSVAWLKAFMLLQKPGRHELSPFMVSIDIENENVDENDAVRKILDKHLSRFGEKSCQTVASTIFPISLWNPNKSADSLYQRYNDCWDIIRHSDRYNANGTYFQRMINYNAIMNDNKTVNQLKAIVDNWKSKNHRRSGLHAAIFDPRKDHVNSRITVFPCLQQVAFNPIGKNGIKGLEVNGFYANQTILEKAYGNYLGLYWLGKFMAKELGLKLTKINCIASVLKLTSGKKMAKISGLFNELKQIKY